jgi:hypothetical protein
MRKMTARMMDKLLPVYPFELYPWEPRARTPTGAGRGRRHGESFLRPQRRATA